MEDANKRLDEVWTMRKQGRMMRERRIGSGNGLRLKTLPSLMTMTMQYLGLQYLLWKMTRFRGKFRDHKDTA